MNIDKADEEHIMYEDFHGEFDGNLYPDLVADDILYPNANQNNSNIEGNR